MKLKRNAAVVVLVLSLSVVLAQTPPELFVFEAGTPIVADQVNSNFQLLRDDIAGALRNVDVTQDDLTELAERIEEVAGIVGPEGPQGESLDFRWDGTRLGVKRADEDSYQYVDLVGPKGDSGSQGAKGDKGDKGDVGSTGPMPDHYWSGTSLAFEQPDGSIGSYVDLAAGSGSIDQYFGQSGTSAAAGRGAECVLGDVWLAAGAVAGATPAHGQTLTISQDQALFSLLGTNYGGDGINTFKLPDLRDVEPKSSNGQSVTYVICVQGIYPAAN